MQPSFIAMQPSFLNVQPRLFNVQPRLFNVQPRLFDVYPSFKNVHCSFKNIHRSVNVVHRSFFVRQHRVNDTPHKSFVVNRFSILQRHSANGEAARRNLLLQNNRNRPLHSPRSPRRPSLRRLLSGYKHPFLSFCK
jgi:hypothetical protein